VPKNTVRTFLTDEQMDWAVSMTHDPVEAEGVGKTSHGGGRTAQVHPTLSAVLRNAVAEAMCHTAAVRTRLQADPGGRRGSED
jgi:hypothetical protein